MPKLAKTGSFFMDHMENSNRRLERMVNEGYGRIELLQQLEFELLRNEFDSSFSSIETQLGQVRQAERNRKNQMIVDAKRRRQKIADEQYRIKQNSVAKQRPPKKILAHARDELALLKQGPMMLDLYAKSDQRNGMYRAVEKKKKATALHEKKKEKKALLQYTNRTEGGTYY